MLPYKVIVSNKTFNYSGTTASGEASFEFLSLSDAKAFATALVAKYSYVIVYIWDGLEILQYIAVNKNGLVVWSEFNDDTLNFPAQGSAEFNGTSDYIDLDDALNFTTESFTISYWVNTTMTGGGLVLAKRSGSTTPGYEFGISNGDISFYLVDTDGSIAFDTADTIEVNDGEWHFITCVVDKSQNKVFRYADGSNTGTNDNISSIGSLEQNTQHTLIGARWNDGVPGSGFFDGNLANVAIWNRALSSDEINSVMFKSYDSLEASEKNGLQAWYSLDDISGTSVPDSSGNGNDGTAY